MEHLTIASNYSEEIFRLRRDAAITKEDISFEILSEATYNDFEAIDAAAKYRAKATLSDDTVVDFSEIEDVLERALLRLSYAKEESDKEYAESEIVKIVSDKWQLTFSESDLNELSEKVNVEKIKESIARREAAIRLSHSHTMSATFTDNYISMYTELLNIEEKVILLSGPTASGKSVAMRSLYEQSRDAGANPIFTSGKRSIVSNFFSDGHDDHYQSASHENRKGVMSVINSLVGDRYKSDREKCEIVFIDELEDLFTHIATGTIGTEFGHRIDVMSALESLLKNAKKVVVADAMVSNMSIDKLCKMAGCEEAKIYRKNTPEMPTIKLASKDETIGVTRERLLSGKKTAVFMDYNAKSFSAVSEALSHESDKNVLKLNSEYFTQSDRSLSQLDEILEENDGVIISPVINAGTSITSEAYDEVSVLAGRTITPNSILQAARRFRAAKTINLAFRGGRSSTRITDPVSFIASMVKDSENPVADAVKHYDNEHGRFLAEYATAKNKQFWNFEQTLVIAAQQMGFKIERPEVDANTKAQGQKAAKAGRKKNAEIQREVAQETAEKMYSQDNDSVDFGTTEERTFEQEVASRTVSGMNTLSISQLTDKTYNEIFVMEIDRVVDMRKMLSGSEAMSDRMSIASSRVVKFLEDSGINLSDLSESCVTTETAEMAYDRLIEPVAISEDATMSGLELMKLFFEDTDVNVTAKFRTVVIKNILKSIGYDLKATGNGRNRHYNVAELNKKLSINGEKTKVNITEVADQYTSVTLSNDFDYNAKPEATQLLVTVEEKRLAKNIERKNEQMKKEAEEAGVKDWVPSFRPKYKELELTQH